MKKILVTFVISVLCWANATAQTITGMVNLPPGSNIDLSMRLLLGRYDEVFGTNSVVINRPGGTGHVGINAFVTGQNVNGVGLLMATHGSLLETSADKFSQLKPVIEVFRSPLVLVVRKNFPANTFDEYVDYVRANPGRVSSGTSATSTFPVVTAIESRNRYKTNYIVYGGNKRGELDVASGVLDSFWAVAPAIIGTGYQDQVKVLLVTSKHKIAGLPSTVVYGNDRRVGEFYLHFTVWTLNKTSDSDVERLNTRFNALLKSSWGQETFSKNGSFVTGGPVEDSIATWNQLRANYTSFKEKHPNLYE